MIKFSYKFGQIMEFDTIARVLAFIADTDYAKENDIAEDVMCIRQIGMSEVANWNMVYGIYYVDRLLGIMWDEIKLPF